MGVRDPRRRNPYPRGQEAEYVQKAGDFDPSDPATPQLSLALGKEYKLVVASGNDHDFEETHNVVVTNKPFTDPHDKRHCVVRLPPAREIRSERRITVGPTGEPPFAGTDGALLRPTQVSMVQIFFYDATSVEILEDGVPMGGWIPKADLESNTADLHFFAGSEKEESNEHVIEAYQNLSGMFGLDISPVGELWVDAIDPQPPIPGLTANDLMELNERNKVRPLALSGSNCDALVVHNHTQRQQG